MGCVSSNQKRKYLIRNTQQDVDNDECVKCIISKFPIKTFRDIIFKRKYNEECQIVCLTGRILPIPSQKSYFTPILEKYAVYAHSSIYLQAGRDHHHNYPHSLKQILPETDMFGDPIWQLKAEEQHEVDFYLVDPAYPTLKIRVKGSKKCKVKPQEFCYNLPEIHPSNSTAALKSPASFFTKRNHSGATTTTSSFSGQTTATESTDMVTNFSSVKTDTKKTNTDDNDEDNAPREHRPSFSSPIATQNYVVLPGGSTSVKASASQLQHHNNHHPHHLMHEQHHLSESQQLFLQNHRIASSVIKNQPIKLVESSIEVGQQVIVLGVLSRVVEGKRASYVLEPIQNASITEKYMNRKKWKSFQREIFLQFFKNHQTMIVADSLFLNRKKPFPTSLSFTSTSSVSSSSPTRLPHDEVHHVHHRTIHAHAIHPESNSIRSHHHNHHGSQHIELEDLEDAMDIHAIGYRHQDIEDNKLEMI